MLKSTTRPIVISLSLAGALLAASISSAQAEDAVEAAEGEPSAPEGSPEATAQTMAQTPEPPMAPPPDGDPSEGDRVDQEPGQAPPPWNMAGEDEEGPTETAAPPPGLVETPTEWPSAPPAPSAPSVQSRRPITRSEPLPPLRPWHLRVVGGASQVFARDPSLDALKSDDLLSVAGPALELEWLFGGAIPVILQVGYGTQSFDDDLFQELDTSLEQHSLQVSVMAGYRLWDAVLPFVRGGFVGSWTEVTIEGGEGAELGGWTFSPGAFAMAGVEISLPRSWMRAAFRTRQFTVGLRVEGGYYYFGPIDQAIRADTEGLMDREQASLGELSLDGAAMSVAGIVSF